MQRQITAAVLCATLFGLAGCGSDDVAVPATDVPPTITDQGSDGMEPTTTATDPVDEGHAGLATTLAGRTFLSSEIDGDVLVEGTQIRLTFQRDSINAAAGCNTLGGRARYDGAKLLVDDMFGTEMGCEPDLQDQDEWLSALLKSHPTLTLERDTLTMTSSDMVITFVDAATAEPAQPLAGTTWNLDTTITGEAASSVPANSAASIIITDANAEVHTGCNRGSARVEIADDTITFGPMATTKMACEQPLMDLEFFVTSVMTGQVSYAIEADRLTLTTQSGAGETIGLVFVAQ